MVFQRNCLILSPYPEPIIEAVSTTGDRPVVAEEISGFPDWIISYGHRHIIREPQLSLFRDRIVNLHISYLPWGRGADPNLWAWVDGGPHGVTLHYIDAGIDTGDIIAQRRVEMDENETLASSYAKLREAAETLFAKTWPLLRNGRAERRKQPPGGSHRSTSAKASVPLPKGWDTPVNLITASRAGLSIRG